MKYARFFKMANNKIVEGVFGTGFPIDHPRAQSLPYLASRLEKDQLSMQTIS